MRSGLSTFWGRLASNVQEICTFADNVSVALGYDAGVKGAFATVTNDSTVNGRSVRASGTWFQKGNHIRAEGTVHLDGRSSLWGS